MATVTKKDLICAVSEKCGCQQSAARTAVQSFLDQIIEELSSNNRIELREFGVFETRTRDAHMARNPRTKESVSVPARASVKFKAGHAMKEKVQAVIGTTAPPVPPPAM